MTLHVSRAGDDGADSIAHEKLMVAFQEEDSSLSSMMTLAAFQEEDTAPATLSFEDDTLNYEDYPTTTKKVMKPRKPVVGFIMATPKKAMKPATTSTLPNSASDHVKLGGSKQILKDTTDAIELVCFGELYLHLQQAPSRGRLRRPRHQTRLCPMDHRI